MVIIAKKVFYKSRSIISDIRNKNKPHLIKLDTFRHLEHCGPNNDFLKYRDKKEIKKWLKEILLKIIKKS